MFSAGSLLLLGLLTLFFTKQAEAASLDTMYQTNRSATECVAGMANGIVFRDDNGDGAFGSEPTVAGVVIGAYDSNGTLLADAVTDGTGQWSMSGLPRQC